MNDTQSDEVKLSSKTLEYNIKKFKNVKILNNLISRQYTEPYMYKY